MMSHVSRCGYHGPRFEPENLGFATNGYYVAYMPITLPCILFMFVETKLIYCHSCVIFVMKSMSICNDQVNYDEIIIQWPQFLKDIF